MTAISSREASYDAIVIGGGVGGLVAAAYLARYRARTILFEARDVLGGGAETATIVDGFRAPLLAHTLYALDRQVVRDLRLRWRGFAFAERDMRLVALRPGGGHIVFSRTGLSAQNGVAVLSASDVAAYRQFRRDTLAFARRLRPLWDATLEDVREREPIGFETMLGRLRLSREEADQFHQLQLLSAAAYLDNWFESDALKAALSFDAGMGGLSPQESGSALMLAWRLAQESGGLQAAVSQLKGGTASLTAALMAAAEHHGADIRTGARVASIAVESGRPAGVVLASGEVCSSRMVVSNLDARETLLKLLPPEAIGFGAAATVPEAAKVAEARVLLALSGPVPIAGLDLKDLRSRLIVAEHPESIAEAKGAALAGESVSALVIEATVPSVADPQLAPAGCHVLSVTVPYVPGSPPGGWTARRDILTNRVIAQLESFAPGLKDRIVASQLLTPEDIALRYGVSPGLDVSPRSRLLASYATRVRTAVPGLFLCGSGAEPVSAISGRAGRMAAALAVTDLEASWRAR